jgi:murein DD-endopeptidase MepM/ murein hydrolase activator NlpD
LNPAQRNRTAALLKATGFEDSAALTLQSTDGDIPHGRELSFAWLAGTVMTGLTSVLLMGAALYVSFQGQDTFSTAYEALQILTEERAPVSADLVTKQDRVRPQAQTRSELEIVEASIKETIDGRDMIRKQPFVRLRATLATAATSISEDVPEYDPVEILNANQPAVTAETVNPEIYGADVEGEVQIKLAALPLTLVPPRAISDQTAAEFVRITIEGTYAEQEVAALAYASVETPSVRELGTLEGGMISDVAENVTVLPKTKLGTEAGAGRSERFLTVKEVTPLADLLGKNGFTEVSIRSIVETLRNVLPSLEAPVGARMRILYGPSRTSDTLIPYRFNLYFHNAATDTDEHAVTIALTDRGNYVIGAIPSDTVIFPEEDTEEVDVSALPSIYRSIWETARKHDIDDETTQRILAMYAYDVDLTKKITPGDTIEMLQTEPDADGNQELLYVSLKLGSTVRELFRFRTDDGTVDYFDPSGETGKRFLVRRPLEGGGRLSSRFGTRVHPIYKRRIHHNGVDLSAPRGTPIYAAGDGVIERAQRVSGYGLYVEISHVNNFETGYGHMSKIADGIKPGVAVRQGQIIGYVGSTGNSTGNHLHFEIKVNGRFVDPLSVKLPRDKSLPSQYADEFAITVAQIRDLMQRDPAPVTVASVD